MASELVVRELPFDVPPVHVDSLWHLRQGQRSEHRVLRLAVAATGDVCPLIAMSALRNAYRAGYSLTDAFGHSSARWGKALAARRQFARRGLSPGDSARSMSWDATPSLTGDDGFACGAQGGASGPSCEAGSGGRTRHTWSGSPARLR